MFDPFKREKTESNKPITGNDFKLLWGNLDKATEVIKEAQIDYKDGDAYFPADPECGGQPIWTECEDGFAKICAPICEPGFYLTCVPDDYDPDADPCDGCSEPNIVNSIAGMHECVVEDAHGRQPLDAGDGVTMQLSNGVSKYSYDFKTILWTWIPEFTDRYNLYNHCLHTVLNNGNIFASLMARRVGTTYYNLVHFILDKDGNELYSNMNVYETDQVRMYIVTARNNIACDDTHIYETRKAFDIGEPVANNRHTEDIIKTDYTLTTVGIRHLAFSHGLLTNNISSWSLVLDGGVIFTGIPGTRSEKIPIDEDWLLLNSAKDNIHRGSLEATPTDLSAGTVFDLGDYDKQYDPEFYNLGSFMCLFGDYLLVSAGIHGSDYQYNGTNAHTGKWCRVRVYNRYTMEYITLLEHPLYNPIIGIPITSDIVPGFGEYMVADDKRLYIASPGRLNDPYLIFVYNLNLDYLGQITFPLGNDEIIYGGYQMLLANDSMYFFNGVLSAVKICKFRTFGG